jgi:hypothetical protein
MSLKPKTSASRKVVGSGTESAMLRATVEQRCVAVVHDIPDGFVTHARVVGVPQMHANNTAAATTRMEDCARKLLRNVIISSLISARNYEEMAS